MNLHHLFVIQSVTRFIRNLKSVTKGTKFSLLPLKQLSELHNTAWVLHIYWTDFDHLPLLNQLTWENLRTFLKQGVLFKEQILNEVK